jgi:hypothetical protein
MFNQEMNIMIDSIKSKPGKGGKDSCKGHKKYAERVISELFSQQIFHRTDFCITRSGTYRNIAYQKYTSNLQIVT